MTKVEFRVGGSRVELERSEALRVADELRLLGTLASRAIASQIERATTEVSIVRAPDDPVDALLLLRAVGHLQEFAPSAGDRELGQDDDEREFTAGLCGLLDGLIEALGASLVVYELETAEERFGVFWSSSGPYWTSDRLVASRRAWRVVSATQPKEGEPGRILVEPWMARRPP